MEDATRLSHARRIGSGGPPAGGILLLDALSVQQFENADSLDFTRPFRGPDPLPQVLAIAGAAANFGFTITGIADPLIEGNATYHSQPE